MAGWCWLLSACRAGQSKSSRSLWPFLFFKKVPHLGEVDLSWPQRHSCAICCVAETKTGESDYMQILLPPSFSSLGHAILVLHGNPSSKRTGLLRLCFEGDQSTWDQVENFPLVMLHHCSNSFGFWSLSIFGLGTLNLYFRITFFFQVQTSKLCKNK